MGAYRIIGKDVLMVVSLDVGLAHLLDGITQLQIVVGRIIVTS